MCAYGTSRQPRGAALVIVMLVMAVLLIAGTAFLTISATEIQIALNERAAAQASLLAEGAIHKAIAQLNANSSYPGETVTFPDGRTFTVSATTASVQQCPGNPAKDLIATAVVPVRGGQARVQLRVTVDRVSYPYRWAAFATVPNAVVNDLWDPLAGVWRDRTDQELFLDDDTKVDSFDSSLGPYDASNSGKGGNIGANGDVYLDERTQIRGSVKAGDDIYYFGSLTYGGSGISVEGARISQAPPEEFPALTPPMPPTAGLTVPGSTTKFLTSGTYSYTTMTFGDNSSLVPSGGPVTIYVSDGANLGNNVTLGTQPGGQLRIFMKSDGADTDTTTFTAGDYFLFYGSLYGKNADVYLRYDAQIYGSMIARTIRVENRAGFHFDQALSDQPLCHNSPKFTIRRGTWREVIP